MNQLLRKENREGAHSILGQHTGGGILPVFFLVMIIVGIYFSQLPLKFIVNEVVNRFIRNGFLVLALIIPINAGMGINFAITSGALTAQVGYLLALHFQINGMPGLLFVTLVAVVLSSLVGIAVGAMLNRVRGKEMITTIIIGYLTTGLYQLVFMLLYGTLIPVGNEELVLSRGWGVRNTVDLKPFSNMLDDLLSVQVLGIRIPFFMFILVGIGALAVYYLLHTPLGRRFNAVAESYERAEMAGLNGKAIRIQAMICSMVLSGLGQVIYLQNLGTLQVYTAQNNTDIFSCAALLAGGATLKRAKVSNAMLGIILFHMLFIVSPQAGQNIFQNAALGEYFRSFVVYGTIAFAIVVNARNSRTGRI